MTTPFAMRLRIKFLSCAMLWYGALACGWESDLEALQCYEIVHCREIAKDKTGDPNATMGDNRGILKIWNINKILISSDRGLNINKILISSDRRKSKFPMKILQNWK